MGRSHGFNWTPERRAEVSALRASGLMYYEISKQLSVKWGQHLTESQCRSAMRAPPADGKVDQPRAVVKETKPAIEFAAMLPVDEEADERMAKLRAAQPPEAKRPIAPEADPDARAWQNYKPRPALSITQPGRITQAPVRRRAIVGDVHCKYQDRKAESVGLAIIREFQPHSIWQTGDLLDCEAISDFGQQRLSWDSLAAELYEGNLFLDRLQSTAPNAELVLLGGNHDDPGPEGRPGKYAAKHPQTGHGITNTPVELYIEPREYTRPGAADLRGGKYIRVAQQPHVDGLSAMFHGIGWESSGYAKLIADRYIPANCHGVQILYGGHMHGLASASGAAGGIYQCVGWWGDRKHEVVTYKKKKGLPADWHNAIVLEESTPHSVHYQVVRIVNGAALFSGQIYASKEAA